MIKETRGIFLLYLLRSTLCIPLNQFYPFGLNLPEPNQRLGDGNSITSGPISPNSLYRFYGQVERVFTVSVNGAIFFGQGTNTDYVSNQMSFPLDMGRKFVAPFWADVDTTSAGEVWYRESTVPTLLARATTQINNAFPLVAPRFSAVHLFIVTWDHVGYFDNNMDKTNTFQCILATNQGGSETYAIFLYADGEIQWTTGDSADDGGTNGLGGHQAQIGLNRGDGNDFTIIPISGTNLVIDVASTSNVGQNGVYIFKISDINISPVTMCTDNISNIEYNIGETYQRDCATRCVCERGGQISCVTVPCPIDGPTCFAWGDPHYTTFDGTEHHYQGACEYTYVERCMNSEFSIKTRNIAHNTRVSCVGEVTIEVPMVTIVLRRGNPVPVIINGLPVVIPGITIYNSNGVEVRRIGSSIHVFLNTIGIRVFWDGSTRIDVTVSTTLINELCGLCGTYNDNPSDDLQRSDGVVVGITSTTDFGDSWLVAGSCANVGKRDAQGTANCSVDPEIIQEGQNRCSVLTGEVFSSCNSVVDPTRYIEDCEFDYCCCGDADRESCYCDNLAAYATACAAAGVVLSTWRNSFCSANCPTGMVYQQCGSFCPPTCDDINATATCQGGCAEGCFCPDGQVLLDGECVDPFVCTACNYTGVLYGEGTQIQPNCTSRCTCQNREFQCEEQTCFADGPTCYAYGDPHYLTYDLQHYNFQGDCEYVLTTPCDNDEFTVVVGNVAKSTISSSTQLVRISVPGEGLEIVLGSGNGGTVTINGISHLDTGDGSVMLSGGVEVVRSGGHPHVLLGTQGIKIFWDGINRVEVTVSTSWQGMLCGLCGNYNDNPADDFTGPDGQQLSNANDFISSWAVGNTSSCGTLSEGFCFGDLFNIATATCNVLQSEFFAPCHAAVDPQPFIDACVDDYCIFCNETNRDDCLCRSLATYASVCNAAGVLLQEWRDIFCPSQCPVGMLFQQCGPLCPQVCDAPAMCSSGCAEGCFCPDGQVADDNGQCVQPGACPGTFGDPHFIVPLQSKQVLCYSIQGYPGLAFNLIYNKNFIINAHFLDSNGDKDEATWIGKLAVIPQNGNRSDAVVFDSTTQEVIIVGQGSFKASVVKQIMFNKDGKISVKFTKGLKKQVRNPTMHVEYFEPHACFNVTFHDNHLNVNWNLQYDNLPEMHGLMGQFMTKGLDIDSRKQILIYPDDHDPVPVTKDTKMTGDPNKPCWKAMNNGIQGEGLIRGNILDYVVSNILEDDFAFKKK